MSHGVSPRRARSSKTHTAPPASGGVRSPCPCTSRPCARSNVGRLASSLSNPFNPMRFHYLWFGLGLFLLSPVSTAQSLQQTAGPPGAQFFGAAEHDGRLFAAGRYGGLFTREAGGWATEPVGLRLGTLYATSERLFAYNASELFRYDDPEGWVPAWDGYVSHLWVGADSLLVLVNDTLYVSGDDLDWRMALRGRGVLDGSGTPLGEALLALFEAVQAPDGAFWAASMSASTSGMYRSEDGEAWVHLSDGLPIFSFPRTLFVSTAGDVLLAESSAVYAFDETAETWVAQQGLAQVTPIRFVEAGGALFLHGYASGAPAIYRRDGANWTEVVQPESDVIALAPSPDGLFALGLDGLYEG